MIEASIAIIAITTSNSINVKPFRRFISFASWKRRAEKVKSITGPTFPAAPFSITSFQRAGNTPFAKTWFYSRIPSAFPRTIEFYETLRNFVNEKVLRPN